MCLFPFTEFIEFYAVQLGFPSKLREIYERVIHLHDKHDTHVFTSESKNIFVEEVVLNRFFNGKQDCCF